MFSRRDRFPRARFPEALRSGVRAASEHFSALRPRKGRGYAVVISKKTLRLAVERHALKRRVLATLKTLPLPPALIVFPRPGAYTLSEGQLRAELTTLLASLT